MLPEAIILITKIIIKMSNRLKLSQDDVSLLTFSAGNLIPLLDEKPNLMDVKQGAFLYYSEKHKQYYQVQVTVTRDENYFIDDFTTEETSIKF